MSPDLMRVLLYVFVMTTGVLLGRLYVYKRDCAELLAELRRYKRKPTDGSVVRRDRDKAGITTISLTPDGRVKLEVSPGLPPGTSLEAIIYTPEQADALVEAIGRLRRVSAATSMAWTKNPNKPMVN